MTTCYIDTDTFIKYLRQIADLNIRLEELQKELSTTKKESMMWFEHYQKLKEKYEPEEETDE